MWRLLQKLITPQSSIARFGEKPGDFPLKERLLECKNRGVLPFSANLSGQRRSGVHEETLISLSQQQAAAHPFLGILTIFHYYQLKAYVPGRSPRGTNREQQKKTVCILPVTQILTRRVRASGILHSRVRNLKKQNLHP